jgi:hypothetical protein
MLLTSRDAIFGRHKVGAYLQRQQAIIADHGTTARDKTAAGRQLYDLAQANRELLDRIAHVVVAARKR